MTPEYFVSKLKELAPTKKVLSKNGFGEDEILQIINSYECVPKSQRATSSKDSILGLLAAYDCSNIEIGLIKFKDEVSETLDYYIVGEVEADVLAVSKITKEVYVLDYTDLNHVISFCASNGGAFLDALLSFASYLGQKLSDGNLVDNPAFIKHWVHICAEKAGGEKYLDFYRMLLGDFDS